ncbi:hypothetical protein PHMEG_00035051 [Phytophthora megakarya]|uniref:Uncharacterized protein n=1 Tax=Phytophthora megakarya TaxID=4795 RepID=A0A225UPT7_9STRA|nr:hypothetical protein PHMEG_00035051 [Phytophthora megakarya]
MPTIGTNWTSEPHDSRPAATTATLSIFAHNATVFRCTVCGFSAPQLADLRSHRHRQQRTTTFTDVFHSGCACAASFAQRAAATKHSIRCETSQSAPSTERPLTQQLTADTQAAEGGSTVTRRNPPSDSATTTSSNRPWRARRSLPRVPLRFSARRPQNETTPPPARGSK